MMENKATALKTKSDLAFLLSISFPMIISQGTDTVMLFVDRLFLSRLGTEYIAPAMSGGLTSFVIISLFLGITGYVNAIVAQYYGANLRTRCSSALAQAVYLSFAGYPVLIFASPLVKHLFIVVGHTDSQVLLEYSYFSVLIFGSLFSLLRNSLAGFFIGIGKTRIVMTASIIGMCVNIPLNYLLIFGKLFFPRLEIIGAAIGTIGGNIVSAGILIVVYLSRHYRHCFKTSRNWKPDIPLLKKLLYYGFPSGIEGFLNVFAFNLFLQLFHSVSEDVAAAVTITFNYDMVAFIPMVGLNMATTSVVGRHMGAGDIKGAEKATWLALRVAWVYAGSMMLLFVFGAPFLVRVFLPEAASAFQGNVVSLAEVMLRLAAFYTLADATQLVTSGALKGAGDTHWIMRATVTAHWIMAVISFFMIKVFSFQPVVIWIFFIFFVISLGCLLVVRFRGGTWKRIRLV
ncbi:MAG: MATE family efflux transporter [Spirochaetales bacterium]|nr:MATE family efflux transporter [Spirochaetales bacterium]